MNTVQRILRRASRIPAEMAHKVSNLPLVEAKLQDRRQMAIAMHARSLPQIAESDQAIVDSLRRSGVYQTSLDELAIPKTDKMFDAGQALAATYSSRALLGADAFFKPQAIQAEAAEVLQHPEIFLWGLSKRLLALVECYLGLPVGYDGINFFYTLIDTREIGARKWHRDLEDERMVKIAVYLNDVDMDGGPLEILRRSFESEGTSGPAVLTQARLEQMIGGPAKQSDVITCTGAAGSVIFVDTARFYHRGRPATKRNRSAVFFNYFARPPRNPYYCERSTLSRRQVAALAAPLTQEQRAAACWRESLPVIARLIPPAPI